jgi:hypothetical protein
MDELIEHAEKHCSHLTKDNYFWFAKMVDLLASQESGVPSFYHSRYCIYDANDIPKAIYEMFDTQAFHAAMKKRSYAQAT